MLKQSLNAFKLPSTSFQHAFNIAGQQNRIDVEANVEAVGASKFAAFTIFKKHLTIILLYRVANELIIYHVLEIIVIIV